MAGGLAPGRCALTILPPLLTLFLSLPVLAQDPENDPEGCSRIWEAIGLPETEQDTDEDPVLVCHQAYILGHSRKNGTPDWVIEHLTRKLAKGNNSRPRTSFAVESHLPDGMARGHNADYERSGFDRGHQAPSNDFKSSTELMQDTFFYSNVVPQVGKGFNRGIWKQLEALVRQLAISRGEIFVITGPVYQEGKVVKIRDDADACGTKLKLRKLPKSAIGGNVAVPAALYKIIYDPKRNRLNAYVLPNIDHREVQGTGRDLDYLQRYRVGLGTVEKLTGLSFMTALDERMHRKLDRECPDTMLH